MPRKKRTKKISEYTGCACELLCATDLACIMQKRPHAHVVHIYGCGGWVAAGGGSVIRIIYIYLYVGSDRLHMHGV